MPTPKQRAQAQAIYLKELNEVALVHYQNKIGEWDDNDSVGPFPLPIDPQGRVLIDVSLDDYSWNNIYEKIYRLEHPAHSVGTPIPPIAPQDLVTFKNTFKDRLGHPIESTTTFSLDIQDEDDNENATSSLLSSLRKHLPEKNKEAIIAQYLGLPKGRITSLQQETHFHAHLIGRMVRTAVAKDTARPSRDKGPDTDAQFQKALDKALLGLNEKVLELQASALKKAFDKADKTKVGGVLTITNNKQFQNLLNEELDNARKKLLPDIAKAVRINLIKETGIKFDKDITKHLSKHLAEATVATTNDCVHVDKGTGFISFIGASKHTSHHSELGKDHTADRIMYSHHLKEDGEVVPLAHRQQIRVPSIAIKVLHKVTESLIDQIGTDDAKPPLDARITALDPKGKLSSEERAQITDEYTRITAILNKQLLNDEKPTKEQRKAAFDKVILDDTVNKIAHIQTKYHLGGETGLPTVDGMPKAFIYNLFTTINKDNIAGRYDENTSKNKQTQSAEHILKAAHKYNRANFNIPDAPGLLDLRARKGAPLCLVQNLAVNGWGHKLDINANLDKDGKILLGEDDKPKYGKPGLVINEAALMAQLATLHTIYDELDEDSQKKVKTIFAEYNAFLEAEDAPEYFFSYLKGKKHSQTLGILSAKDEIKIANPAADSIAIVPPAGTMEEHRVAFTTNAKTALAALFKNEAYAELENGFTYQALSVFVEEASMGGCKSANERAQGVNGRVSILDFVSLDKTTRDGLLKRFVSEADAVNLKKFSDDLENDIKNRNRVGITQNLDNLYESLNLEGFQALISFIDQGGHSKLQSKKGIFSDTNQSETVQNHAKNASKWQCHKGLSENVLKEFCGEGKKFSAGKEIGIGFGKIVGAAAAGAAAAGVAGGIALGVTMLLSVAFPPIGIIVGLAAAAAAAVALIAVLASVIPKWWKSRDSVVEGRFAKIQADNDRIIEEHAAEVANAREEAPAQRVVLSSDLDNGVAPVDRPGVAAFNGDLEFYEEAADDVTDARYGTPAQVISMLSTGVLPIDNPLHAPDSLSDARVVSYRSQPHATAVVESAPVDVRMAASKTSLFRTEVAEGRPPSTVIPVDDVDESLELDDDDAPQWRPGASGSVHGDL